MQPDDQRAGQQQATQEVAHQQTLPVRISRPTRHLCLRDDAPLRRFCPFRAGAFLKAVEKSFEQGPVGSCLALQSTQLNRLAILRAGLGCWGGAAATAAAQVVDAAHGELMAGFSDYDIVGFHGQTLAHAPRHQGTFQVGDGAALAEKLGKPVVWDFRSDDVAMGGE
ncbi:MAG: anhydro-N-acetylmuramic acid kinase, partial [Xanthomonadales bacterium]|nr:anhydro-N-acetylmuramic acid kinase [Xanthomonadales bacterium]